MDWKVSRSPELLWQEVQQLLRDPSTTIFHDIILHCSDGPLPWNRLCLALSFPSCEAVLAKDLNSESEVAVSLPDLTVWQAKEVLEGSLPKSSKTGLHPSLQPSTTSYTLVPHGEVEDRRSTVVEDEDDFFAAELLDQSGGYGSESEAEEKPDIEDLKENILKKKCRKQAEKQSSRDSKGVLISNDLADYVMTECHVCGIQKPMTFLRAHTKSAHKLTITEYKQRFGAQLEMVEKVLHECALCQELIILDSDHIAVHLKKPGHSITHKDYNQFYMADTRESTPSDKTTVKKVKTENSFIKEEPVSETPLITGKRRRQKKSFFDDYDYAVALSLADGNDNYDIQKAVSRGDIAPKKNVDLEDIKNMEQLWKDCKVSVLNYKLTEEEVAAGGIDLSEEENYNDTRIEVDLPKLPRIEVDSSHGRPEEEEVEQHMTRYLVGGKVVKECNICHYTTDRFVGNDIFVTELHIT